MIVPSLNGSVIVVWFDSHFDEAIFAQRLDANGNPMWAPNGVLVERSSRPDRPPGGGRG